MKAKGRLLYFDTLDMNGNFFSKDIDLYIPERVPVLFQFIYNDLKYVLGHGSIEIDDKGLICNLDLYDDKFKYNGFDLVKDVGLGGFYTNVECEYQDNKKIIKKAKIFAIGITHRPVNPSYKIEEYMEDENAST